MNKFIIKCFDNEELAVQFIVEADDMFDVIERYKKEYTVKVYSMSTENETPKF